MIRLSIIALAFFAGSVYTATNESRIVGGSPATIFDWPFVLQIESREPITGTWSQTCAGSIISQRYALTAAHCLFGGIFDHRTRAGVVERGTRGIVTQIIRIINHPTYGQNGADGDIGILMHDSILIFSPVIRNTPIHGHGSFVPHGWTVKHAGWGSTTQGGPPSPQLLETQLYTINHNLCRERYAGLTPHPAVVTGNMVCAGLLDVGGHGACEGDAGGPMVIEGVLIGVVSWGQGCADAYYPGVSTRVSSYTNWIINNTR